MPRADRLNAPRQIESRNIVLRLGPHRGEARQVRYASHDEAVTRVESSRVNPHQHAVILDHRPVDLLDFKDGR
jgi:hypothetical protein